MLGLGLKRDHQETLAVEINVENLWVVSLLLLKGIKNISNLLAFANVESFFEMIWYLKRQTREVISYVSKLSINVAFGHFQLQIVVFQI